MARKFSRGGRDVVAEREVALPLGDAITYLHFNGVFSAIRESVPRSLRREDLPTSPRDVRRLLMRTRWGELASIVRTCRKRFQDGAASRSRARDDIEIIIDLLKPGAHSQWQAKWPHAEVWALKILAAVAADDRPTALRAYAEFRGSLGPPGYKRLQKAASKYQSSQRRATGAAAAKRSNAAQKQASRIREIDHELATRGVPKRSRASLIMKRLSKEGADVSRATVSRALRQ